MDPYSTIPLEPSGAPDQTQPKDCNPCKLEAGRYSKGISYSNNVTLNLEPGIYYVDSKFSLKNNVTMNAPGVTIVFIGDYAMDIGNNITINITAPDANSGLVTAGIAFASIRTATATTTQTFSNNSTLNLTGAIYFPNQIVEFENNSVINTSVCGQVIARIVQIQNNANLKNNCVGTGVTPVTGGAAVQLVE